MEQSAKTDAPDPDILWEVSVSLGTLARWATAVVVVGLLLYFALSRGNSEHQQLRADPSPDVRTTAFTPVSTQEKHELEKQTRNVVIEPLPDLVHGPAFITESARIEVIAAANLKGRMPFRLASPDILTASGLLEEVAQRQPLQAFYLDRRYPMLPFHVSIAKQPVRKLVFLGEGERFFSQGEWALGIENPNVGIGILGEAQREPQYESEFFLWREFERLGWENELFEPRLYVGGQLERYSEREIFYVMLCSLTLEARPTTATVEQLKHPVDSRYGLSRQAAEGYAGGSLCVSQGVALADATSPTPVTYAEYNYAIRQGHKEANASPVSEATYEEYTSRLEG